MERKAYDIFSGMSGEVGIRVIPGHFATKHSHVTSCIDMTQVKSQLNAAKAAAKLLASNFSYTPVDTIVSFDRMKMVGAFMAEELSHTGVNQRQNIAVITPEIKDEKLVMRDNFLPFIKDKHVLILTASATTGKTVESGVEGISYYGGLPVGAATVFGGDFRCGVPVVRLFGVEDIGEYASYAPRDCPLCRQGAKVEAVINSYGYSKLI